MSDTKNVVFRSAVGGYNKNDVNEYLIRSSAELMEREAAASERVKKAEDESSEYLDKLEKLQKELGEMKSALEEKNSEIKKLNSEKKALEERVELGKELDAVQSKEKGEQQEALIAKQFEEIDLLIAENEKLKSQLSNADTDREKQEELVKKAALYEKTSANIGEAIISANKTAEEIISAAKEEARILTERSHRELEEKRSALEESSRRALENIFSKLVLAASESRRDITASSTYSYHVIENALEDIKMKTCNAELKLKNYQESVWRSIKEDLESVNNMADKKAKNKKMTPDQMRKIKRQ